MGYMNSVDIVLTAHKLSDAQKNAVVELLSGGFTTAKPNTIKSLENKGLIKFWDGWELEESFKAELKAAYSQPEPREAELPEWEQELLAEMSEDKAAIIREEMETEFSESDETPIPFFNRKARREFNRNIARYNRRLMREHGKRVRKFGPQNVIIKFIAA